MIRHREGVSNVVAHPNRLRRLSDFQLKFYRGEKLDLVIFHLAVGGFPIIGESARGAESEARECHPRQGFDRNREVKKIGPGNQWLTGKDLLNGIDPCAVLIKIHPGVQKAVG